MFCILNDFNQWKYFRIANLICNEIPWSILYNSYICISHYNNNTCYIVHCTSTSKRSFCTIRSMIIWNIERDVDIHRIIINIPWVLNNFLSRACRLVKNISSLDKKTLHFLFNLFNVIYQTIITFNILYYSIFGPGLHAVCFFNQLCDDGMEYYLTSRFYCYLFFRY